MSRIMTLLIAACAVSLLGACSSTKMIKINSEPTAAIVSHEGQVLGTTPVDHEFDFDKRWQYKLDIKKKGYEPTTLEVTSSTPRQVSVNLSPATIFNATTEDAFGINQWERMAVAAGVSPADAWQRILSTAREIYPVAEVTENDTQNYISKAKLTTVEDQYGQPKLIIQTRFMIHQFTKDPLVYKFKIESKAKQPGGTFKDYDRVPKDQSEMLKTIYQRLRTTSEQN